MFKIIKDWLRIGRRGYRQRHGELMATDQGEALIVVRFEPQFLEAFFVDPEPPNDTCHPHEPDAVHCSFQWIGRGRYAIKIVWHVRTIRMVKFKAEGRPS